MNNRKFYSYERNNYYYGKLLTTRDFQTEQGYMNDKRRLGNRLLHGSGIVSGLKVVAADDTAIVLQSGYAIDGGGREIAVPETQVIKLTTIDGSRDLKTDTAYLSISYDEKKEEKVYAVMGQEEDEGDTYDRIKESYHLTLQDTQDCKPIAGKQDEYIIKRILFEDEEYQVIQEIPRFLPADCNLALKLSIHKKKQSAQLFSISYMLDVEGLKEQSFPIQIRNLKMDCHETWSHSEILPLTEEVRYLSEFKFKLSNLVISKDNKECRSEKQEPVTVLNEKDNLLSFIIENSYKEAMDVTLEEEYDNKIYLAKLHLIRMEDRILVERIEEVPFKQYVYSANQLMLLNHLREYYPDTVDREYKENSQPIQNTMANVQTIAKQGKDFVTGVFDLSLGNTGDTGKICYSEEIMHGLGEGPVYVEVGYEMLNKESGKLREETILGDADLFGTDEAEVKQLQMQCAIKILPERGTFIVALRPKNKVVRTGIKVRWYACKAEDTSKNIEKLKNKQGIIMISPDTITTTPRGVVHIKPNFINMEEEACIYEVLEQAGGTIDNNGVYTAPTAEGVYEIKVSCISNPGIFAHAYIVVSSTRE